MATFSNMLRRNTPTLDADREAYEKYQTISIQKAISAEECAAKEKHVRTTIMGTYHDKSAQVFWYVVRRLPLSTSSIVAWKFCHVLHKVLRDGHHNVLKDSLKYKQQLKDLGRNWNATPHGYGRLIAAYLKCLVQRMEFHKKYKDFPGNLSITDEDLEKIGQNDINAFFELCVDLLDCLDMLMDLQKKSLPADTLAGHRQRFFDCYGKLKKFYYICSNLQYFKRLIQVPVMPEKPPDFLIKSDGSHELGPVQVMPEEQTTEPDRAPSPEPAVAQLIDTRVDDLFSKPNDPFGVNGITIVVDPDPKDAEIERLKAEISKLKAEIEMMQMEHSQEVRRLLDQISDLQRDLEESKLIARDASQEVTDLRKQANEAEIQAEAAVKAQSLLQDIEKRAHSNEEMYKKLKEKHLALVKNHADLLRKNADTKKVAENLQQNAGEIESEKINLRREIEELKEKLEASSFAEKELERKQREEQKRLMSAAADEASQLIRCAISSLDDESKSRTCSAESLIEIVNLTSDSLKKLDVEAGRFKESQEIDGLIQSLASFGHWMAETIENGGATCNMAPDDQGAGLEGACRHGGQITLKYLDDLKEMKDDASIKDTQETLRDIIETATQLLPKISDLRGGDLHDLVEQEMASTSLAVEQAAERIEALLNEARQRDSGVNLEVNERILDSCTELMKTIKMLITSSKDLQREIVSQGRGASSSKEFYMKNSRWTEGLISAAKAVGSGATMLTDSADLVMQGNGKFEELMVWSHEISASTAQLVAASRVKASKGSEKLTRLQNASRDVNGATARVVASTNAGRRQLEDANDSLADLANTVTLTQIKRKEMDSQVKVLELEQALQQERLRLGALRKKHYELAGVKEEEEENNEPENPPPHTNGETIEKPVIAPKPTISRKPALASS